jgi:hypothetical protein
MEVSTSIKGEDFDDQEQNAQLTQEQIDALVKEYERRGFTVTVAEIEGKTKIIVQQPDQTPRFDTERAMIKALKLNGGAMPPPQKKYKEPLIVVKGSKTLKERRKILARKNMDNKRRAKNQNKGHVRPAPDQHRQDAQA